MTSRLRPPVTDSDCRLIGAGDGSVMVYCRPCGACLCPAVTTLNTALGFWEEHQQEHEPPPPTPQPVPDPWRTQGPVGPPPF